MKLHHVGIACDNIEIALAEIGRMFLVLRKTKIVYDAEQGANLCMLEISNGSRIELISGPIVDNFTRRNVQVYHTCWEVSDFDNKLQEFIEKGCTQISMPKEAILFNNKKVAFLKSPIGIMELLES